MVDQITYKFCRGDIVKSIDCRPVKINWRNRTFEVIRRLDPHRNQYDLKPLNPHPNYDEIDTISAEERYLYLAIDQNDIEWWMNNNA